MPFGEFTYPEVRELLGLTTRETNLFADVPAVTPRPEFLATLTAGTNLALAQSTEKARSEFIIAPLLLELRRSMAGSFGLFSGVALKVDDSRGLNGICDFILTKDSRQLDIHAPLVAIVEAKDDNIHNGLGQCVAATYAARLYNQQAGQPLPAEYGVVTTGSAWKFLRLAGTELTFDIPEYYIAAPGQIMGILQHILQSA
jgi:hypothetical protein